MACSACVPVHPHARGEHWAGVDLRRAKCGSSPRPWGTPHHPHHGAIAGRFIPTPVGNTAVVALVDASLAVHPHARGEHDFHTGGHLGKDGSSPRPWGTPTVSAPARLRRRFIPTPVGNTAAQTIRDKAPAVHPHARGEHSMSSLAASSSHGSSPRPWGTRRVHLRQRAGLRFIPTPVGNTITSARPGQRSTVHPHARGEHRLALLIAQHGRGSSPRPWGTPCESNCSLMPAAVHPHARGEHSFQFSL